jgi:hypothetical protein
MLSQYTECTFSSLSNICISVLEKFDDLRNSIHDHIVEYGYKWPSVSPKSVGSTFTYRAQPVYSMNLHHPNGHASDYP